jgi:hypothetical protein
MPDNTNCQRLLESLTPGGSEFHNDPERCAQWIKKKLSSRATLAGQRNEMRDALQMFWDAYEPEYVSAMADDRERSDLDEAADAARSALALHTPGEHEASINIHRAASDLLAALEGLFEHCAMIHKHWGDGDNQKEANAAIAAARAAIAAAKGETP